MCYEKYKIKTKSITKMKKLNLIIALMFAVAISNAQTETLTNENIIALTKIGLQPSVIITKIKNSNTNFDVGMDALIILGNNKVATDVINEMMKTSEGDSKDPKTIHKSGVYYYNKNNAENPVRKIDAIIVTSVSTNTGGYGGFGGSSSWAHVSGLQSKQQISETSPVFYFYFNTNDDMRADWEAGASTPNEFSLVKFRSEKSERLFKVGSSSHGFSSHSNEGIPEKDKVSFSYDLVSEGIYKVTFNNPLAEGEYCFVFNTNTKRVFDFGVH